MRDAADCLLRVGDEQQAASGAELPAGLEAAPGALVLPPMACAERFLAPTGMAAPVLYHRATSPRRGSIGFSRLKVIQEP